MTIIHLYLTAVWQTVRATLVHDQVSSFFSLMVAAIATGVSYILGGYDYPFLMLLMFIVLDYITGFVCASKANKLNSDVMYWGLIRKISEVIIVGIAVAIDRLTNSEMMVIRLMAIYFYLGMEGISILENLVKLGVRVPPKLIAILEHIEQNEVSNEQISQDINKKLDSLRELPTDTNKHDDSEL